MQQTDLIIGTDLDALLAPLDDAARLPALGDPSPATAERAYVLALLAAELTVHAPSNYLLEIASCHGVSLDDALTIGRAFSGALLRVAQTVGSTQAE